MGRNPSDIVLEPLTSDSDSQCIQSSYSASDEFGSFLSNSDQGDKSSTMPVSLDQLDQMCRSSSIDGVGNPQFQSPALDVQSIPEASPTDQIDMIFERAESENADPFYLHSRLPSVSPSDTEEIKMPISQLLSNPPIDIKTFQQKPVILQKVIHENEHLLPVDHVIDPNAKLSKMMNKTEIIAAEVAALVKDLQSSLAEKPLVDVITADLVTAQEHNVATVTTATLKDDISAVEANSIAIDYEIAAKANAIGSNLSEKVDDDGSEVYAKKPTPKSGFSSNESCASSDLSQSDSSSDETITESFMGGLSVSKAIQSSHTEESDVFFGSVSLPLFRQHSESDDNEESMVPNSEYSADKSGSAPSFVEDESNTISVQDDVIGIAPRSPTREPLELPLSDSASGSEKEEGETMGVVTEADFSSIKIEQAAAEGRIPTPSPTQMPSKQPRLAITHEDMKPKFVVSFEKVQPRSGITYKMDKALRKQFVKVNRRHENFARRNAKMFVPESEAVISKPSSKAPAWQPRLAITHEVVNKNRERQLVQAKRRHVGFSNARALTFSYPESTIVIPAPSSSMPSQQPRLAITHEGENANAERQLVHVKHGHVKISKSNALTFETESAVALSKPLSMVPSWKPKLSITHVVDVNPERKPVKVTRQYIDFSKLKALLHQPGSEVISSDENSVIQVFVQDYEQDEAEEEEEEAGHMMVFDPRRYVSDDHESVQIEEVDLPAGKDVVYSTGIVTEVVSEEDEILPISKLVKEAEIEEDVKIEEIPVASEVKTGELSVVSEEKAQEILAVSKAKIEEIPVASEEKTEEIPVASEEKTEEIPVASEEKIEDIPVTSEEKTQESHVASEEKNIPAQDSSFSFTSSLSRFNEHQKVFEYVKLSDSEDLLDTMMAEAGTQQYVSETEARKYYASQAGLKVIKALIDAEPKDGVHPVESLGYLFPVLPEKAFGMIPPTRAFLIKPETFVLIKASQLVKLPTASFGTLLADQIASIRPSALKGATSVHWKALSRVAMEAFEDGSLAKIVGFAGLTSAQLQVLLSSKDRVQSVNPRSFHLLPLKNLASLKSAYIHRLPLRFIRELRRDNFLGDDQTRRLLFSRLSAEQMAALPKSLANEADHPFAGLDVDLQALPINVFRSITPLTFEVLAPSSYGSLGKHGLERLSPSVKRSLSPEALAALPLECFTKRAVAELSFLNTSICGHLTAEQIPSLDALHPACLASISPKVLRECLENSSKAVAEELFHLMPEETFEEAVLPVLVELSNSKVLRVGHWRHLDAGHCQNIKVSLVRRMSKAGQRRFWSGISADCLGALQGLEKLHPVEVAAIPIGTLEALTPETNALLPVLVPTDINDCSKLGHLDFADFVTRLSKDPVCLEHVPMLSIRTLKPGTAPLPADLLANADHRVIASLPESVLERLDKEHWDAIQDARAYRGVDGRVLKHVPLADLPIPAYEFLSPQVFAALTAEQLNSIPREALAKVITRAQLEAVSPAVMAEFRNLGRIGTRISPSSKDHPCCGITAAQKKAMAKAQLAVFQRHCSGVFESQALEASLAAGM